MLDSELVSWHKCQQVCLKGEATVITFLEAELRVKVVKAMAHPVRLMAIEFLRGGERPFSAILGLFQLDKSTVSKHLLVLKEAGIVSSKKAGAEMIYKLEVPCVADFFNCATVVIESNIKKQIKGLRK